MEFTFRFHPADIAALASRYPINNEDILTEQIKPAVRERGYLMLEELKIVCGWKSQRSKSRVAKNEPEDVRAITKVSLETSNERLRIGSLLLLDGIEYPTASVILHFFHPEPYPILDFRALEALNITKPNAYNFRFWEHYVAITRRIAIENGVDMRVLDRALWQWSKERSEK